MAAGWPSEASAQRQMRTFVGSCRRPLSSPQRPYRPADGRPDGVRRISVSFEGSKTGRRVYFTVEMTARVTGADGCTRAAPLQRIESLVATTPIPVPTATPGDGSGPPSPSAPEAREHIAWVVFGSLTAGLVAALLLVAAPFIADEEPAITGAVLCGFALGWAMLAVLLVRFTDQPQAWAAVPAAFMGLGGLLLLVFGSSVAPVLSWVWPPALLALVVWMVVQARRHLRSRSRRWLLYPVIGMLTVAAVGGGYETVSAATDAPPAMPGRSIDVGGHSLHLNCTGTGSPTVVLQPGGGAIQPMSEDIAPPPG